MKDAIKEGLSFGLTSSVITTLGLMVGLDAATNSSLAVIGGILTIAIVDSFSDALGMHLSAESIKNNSQDFVWKVTEATFITKLIFALIYLIPIIFLELTIAIPINIAIGFLLLIILSYKIARSKKEKATRIIAEHIGICLAILIIAYFVGRGIAIVFG
jgi:vacuolar iron transporter family protein